MSAHVQRNSAIFNIEFIGRGCIEIFYRQTSNSLLIANDLVVQGSVIY